MRNTFLFLFTLLFSVLSAQKITKGEEFSLSDKSYLKQFLYDKDLGLLGLDRTKKDHKKAFRGDYRAIKELCFFDKNYKKKEGYSFPSQIAGNKRYTFLKYLIFAGKIQAFFVTAEKMDGGKKTVVWSVEFDNSKKEWKEAKRIDIRGWYSFNEDDIQLSSDKSKLLVFGKNIDKISSHIKEYDASMNIVKDFQIDPGKGNIRSFELFGEDYYFFKSIHIDGTNDAHFMDRNKRNFTYSVLKYSNNKWSETNIDVGNYEVVDEDLINQSGSVFIKATLLPTSESKKDAKEKFKEHGVFLANVTDFNDVKTKLLTFKELTVDIEITSKVGIEFNYFGVVKDRLVLLGELRLDSYTYDTETNQHSNCEYKYDDLMVYSFDFGLKSYNRKQLVKEQRTKSCDFDDRVMFGYYPVFTKNELKVFFNDVSKNDHLYDLAKGGNGDFYQYRGSGAEGAGFYCINLDAEGNKVGVEDLFQFNDSPIPVMNNIMHSNGTVIFEARDTGKWVSKKYGPRTEAHQFIKYEY